VTNEKIGKRVGSPSGELRDSGERALKKKAASGRLMRKSTLDRGDAEGRGED